MCMTYFLLPTEPYNSWLSFNFIFAVKLAMLGGSKFGSLQSVASTVWHCIGMKLTLKDYIYLTVISSALSSCHIFCVRMNELGL